MMQTTPVRPWIQRGQRALLGLVTAAALTLGLPQPAQALTIVLNFVSGPTTDRFGVGTLPETFAAWGFTSLNLAAIRTATLNAVMQDYLGYPNAVANPASPLPVGKELNISFEIATGLTAPLNGDSEYYYMAIGDANPNQTFLGQACLACVRNSSGVSSVAVGTIFGSVLSDSISGLLSLATSDAQRINLLAGTVSHEIGHGLNLVHPTSALANPGASAFSLMATGASPTLMPSAERVKDRAFAYTEFNTLIQSVGLRDVSAVPEADSAALLALGLVALAWRRRQLRSTPA